ncbi:MAG: ABC transporter ATP-binding protein [Waddliaceae bacterium]
MLEVNHLSFSYGDYPVFQDLCFKLKEGGISALIGPSGEGKTTLFKLLTGMLDPNGGTITINGQAPSRWFEQVAYMTQEDLLLPWRTVLKNITLMAELGKNQHRKEPVISKARRLLEEMGMKGCEDLFPDQLSVGMRQRVSLARALLHNRPFLFLDEPFGSLDVVMRENMYALLQNLNKKYGTTILLITHDFRDVLSLSDEIFLLTGHHIEKKWAISEKVRNDPQLSNALLKQMQDGMHSF